MLFSAERSKSAGCPVIGFGSFCIKQGFAPQDRYDAKVRIAKMVPSDQTQSDQALRQQLQASQL